MDEGLRRDKRQDDSDYTEEEISSDEEPGCSRSPLLRSKRKRDRQKERDRKRLILFHREIYPEFIEDHDDEDQDSGIDDV